MLRTNDEARTAFVQSAAALAIALGYDSNLSALLAGSAELGEMPPATKKAIFSHWLITAELEASGHAWLMQEEIEGITSMISAGDDLSSVIAA